MNRNNGTGKNRPTQMTREEAIMRERQRVAEIKRRKERKAVTDRLTAIIIFSIISACIILAVIFSLIF